MRTGRRRKKSPETPSPKPEPAPAQPSSSRPKAMPSGKAKEPLSSRVRSRASSLPRNVVVPLAIMAGLLAILCCFVLVMQTCLGPRAEPTTYVRATATGSWRTTVTQASTCEERVVDDYDDYAYNIYYEEESDQIYQASGAEFVVTQLNPDEDWWEGDRHYVAEEWLDRETCEYTDYTVWITDPGDPEYEVEVILAECEVWDHVVVKEGCPPEGSAGAAQTSSLAGTGTSVEWPPAPAGAEHKFEGTVIFRANGATRTVEVSDVDQYLRYLTVPYYLGLDENGKVVRLTDKAP
jgi:hypothetical protein